MSTSPVSDRTASYTSFRATYPWGEDPPGKLVCWDGAENALGYGNRHDSCDVGTFSGDVTVDGVLDLGGNVAEWTLSAEPSRDAKDDQTQARKGGSWGTKSAPFLLRATSRRVGDFDAYQTGIFTGFRCATEVASARR
jgi:formylglycine-generating enzyme required for sulfatase activity